MTLKEKIKFIKDNFTNYAPMRNGYSVVHFAFIKLTSGYALYKKMSSYTGLVSSLGHNYALYDKSVLSLYGGFTYVGNFTFLFDSGFHDSSIIDCTFDIENLNNTYEFKYRYINRNAYHRRLYVNGQYSNIRIVVSKLNNKWGCVVQDCNQGCNNFIKRRYVNWQYLKNTAIKRYVDYYQNNIGMNSQLLYHFVDCVKSHDIKGNVKLPPKENKCCLLNC